MGLKKNPKDYREWIFTHGRHSEPDFISIVSALGATCTFLDEDHSAALIAPAEGHGKATWEVCRTMFGHITSAQERRQLLENFRSLSLEGPVVHALHRGVPVCGFTTAPQDQWPMNHNWAAVGDIDIINCPTCLRRAKSWRRRSR